MISATEEARKKFLDVSLVRYKLEADEELELIKNDKTMKNFLMANHISDANMLRTAMSSFMTKNQKISSAGIRGQIDPRPRVLMENPNAFALLFQDKYKHKNKNPSFDDNDDPIYRDGEGNIIPAFKTKDDGTNNNLLDGALGINNFWNSWGRETQPGENPEVTPETTSEPGAPEPGEEVLDVDDEDRKEADVTLNRFFQNVQREANETVKINVDQDEYEDRIDNYH